MNYSMDKAENAVIDLTQYYKTFPYGDKWNVRQTSCWSRT